MSDTIEAHWLAAFEKVLALCAVQPGQTVVVLSESRSRPILPRLARLACARLGLAAFDLVMPSLPEQAPVPIRSTGASAVLRGNASALSALSSSTLVLDCTVEGLLHAPELPQILAGGARLLMISNEHPEILERTVPQAADEALVRAALKRLKAAGQMHITSVHGTDLRIDLAGARTGGTWGFANKPGQVAHWPGSLVLAFPARGSVQGRLVLAPGDVNLTFKTYLRDPVALTIVDDEVVAVEGAGLDAQLLRATWQAWEALEQHRACYAVSHVGWGLNPRARWDALAYYDKNDCNGTELRAFAGNVLYSTGANEVAGRYTLGHFDLPLRGCSLSLDGVAVLEHGRLCEMARS
jgi:2,5-dihydroxypyridine 5,6-dioxygenase